MDDSQIVLKNFQELSAKFLSDPEINPRIAMSILANVLGFLITTLNAGQQEMLDLFFRTLSEGFDANLDDEPSKDRYN